MATPFTLGNIGVVKAHALAGRMFYVSDSWARTAYGIISLRSLPINRVEDVAGNTMAATINVAGDSRVVHRYFHSAVVVPETDSKAMI